MVVYAPDLATSPAIGWWNSVRSPGVMVIGSSRRMPPAIALVEDGDRDPELRDALLRHPLARARLDRPALVDRADRDAGLAGERRDQRRDPLAQADRRTIGRRVGAARGPGSPRHRRARWSSARARSGRGACPSRRRSIIAAAASAVIQPICRIMPCVCPAPSFGDVTEELVMRNSFLPHLR